MTDQKETSTNTKQRSLNNATTRLSYECLMSATKSFVHNFATLTDEERAEYKSLATYVKQLDKCLPSKHGNVVSKPKKVVVPVEQSTVVEEKVVEPVKKAAKKGKTDASPVVPVVAEVAAPTVAVVDAKPAQKKSQSKK